jgi:hypothetical protein
VRQKALGPVDVDPTPGGAVVNCRIGGDTPAWCYLGVHADEVVAIAITLVTAFVCGTRPASEDAELLHSLTRRAMVIADDEELAAEWSDLLTTLRSSGGRVTFRNRAQLHSLQVSLVDPDK